MKKIKTKNSTSSKSMCTVLTHNKVIDISCSNDSNDTPRRFLSAKSVYDNLKQSKAVVKVSISSLRKKKKKLKKKETVKKPLSKTGNDLSANGLPCTENIATETSEYNSSDIRISSSSEDENDAEDLSEVPVPNDSSAVNDKSVELASYKTLDSFDYILVNGRSALVYIPFSTCFYFKGRFKLTVICGTVEILGHEMEGDPKKIFNIYSPRGYDKSIIFSFLSV
jgi:hypothetical protein